MSTAWWKNLNKKFKLLLIALFAVAGTTIIFISSQARAQDDNTTYVMYTPGTQPSALNKSQKQTTQLQNALQKQINSLDEVSSSVVKINGTIGDSTITVSAAIKLSSKKELSPEQQTSIIRLIKGSMKDVPDDSIQLSIS